MLANFSRPFWLGLGGLLAASVLLNSALWMLALTVFPDTTAATILHYNASVGVDFIGESSQIVTLPQIGTIILILNGLLGALIWPADRRASWMLWLTTPLTQGILLGAFGLLYRVNV